MGADLGLLSLTHLQKLAQSQQTPNHQPLNPSSTAGSWMWKPNQTTQHDDDSWEVKAFEEDTNHEMGTTWPPRSYTCNFCRREFRSAQALGGHMNVHRRDRAKLHQAPPIFNNLTAAAAATANSSTSSPTLIIPTQELVANGGLCLLYSIPNPNGNNNLISLCPTSINFPVVSRSMNSSHSHSSNTEPSASIDNDNNENNNGSAIEELDLELRLGRSSS